MREEGRPRTTCSTGSPPTTGWGWTAPRARRARRRTARRSPAPPRPGRAAWSTGSRSSPHATPTPRPTRPGDDPVTTVPVPNIPLRPGPRVRARVLGQGPRPVPHSRRPLLFVASTASRPTTGCCRRRSPTRARSSPRCRLWWFDQLEGHRPATTSCSGEVPEAGGRPGDGVPSAWTCSPSSASPAGTSTGSGLWSTGPGASAATAARRTEGRVASCPSRSSPRRPRPSSATHDENVTSTTWSSDRGRGRAGAARLTLAVYARPRRSPAGRGLILADTKFEFGRRPTPGPDRAGRRGADPGLLAVLAGRRLGTRAGRSRRSTSSSSATG
jgi:hypothetical protein